MKPQETLNLAWALMEEERDRLVAEFPQHAELIKRTRVFWGKQMTACAGHACHSPPMIKLSQYFFSKEKYVHEVKSTFAHEMAHILVGPGHAHEPTWEAMARRIGGEDAAREFHFMSNAGAGRHRRWKAICPECRQVLEVTTARARKMKRGATYFHSPCSHTRRHILLVEDPG